jgi:hypothetical protein
MNLFSLLRRMIALLHFHRPDMLLIDQLLTIIGMSAITRTWKVPTWNDRPEYELVIHEPPLTEDNLGLKTWASSYLLAVGLDKLADNHLHHRKEFSKIDANVLELGAGTGLVGIAAAASWGCAVHLTDLPAIVPNLTHNVNANKDVLTKLGGAATAGELDWSKSDDQDDKKYEVSFEYFIRSFQLVYVARFILLCISCQDFIKQCAFDLLRYEYLAERLRFGD